MQKSPQEERNIIISKPNKRPYGIKVQFHIQTLGSIGNLDNVCISMKSGLFLTLSPGKKSPWEGGERMELKLEGFPTAIAAEAAGKRIVQSLLWMAIKQRIALQLQYQSYEPAYVFERNRSLGLSCSGYGESKTNQKYVIDTLHQSYYSLPEPQPGLLLSMEIFAGAKLESSERATYLAMVSALEPLANPKKQDKEVDDFVSQTLENLKNRIEISASVRNSLTSRLKALQYESIGQSLKRLSKEWLPEYEHAEKIIKEAYAIRSQLVHSGQPNDLDIDLAEKIREIEEVIIAIYGKFMYPNG